MPTSVGYSIWKRALSLSKEQVEALKKDAEQKANGYKNSISTFHTSTTYKIDGSVKFQLILVEYEFLNCYKEDHDGDRHCEEWFNAFHEGFNTKSITERACTISYRIARPHSQYEEEHLLFEFCDRQSRDSWDSLPREYDTYFSIAELCLLHEKLQLVHASPIELMDLLFLIAETRAIEIDDFMDESILGTRIEKCVNELTGVEGNGLFQQRPLLGLEVLKAHLKPVQTWGQLHSKITVLALEQYMKHLNANEMDGENNVKLNLKAWMTDKEKTTFLEWKGKEMKILGKTASTDTKSGIGSGVNLAQNNIKVQSSSLKYNRKSAIARLKSAKVSETIKQNDLLRNMLIATELRKSL